jgi:hypothetical protein
VISEDSGEEGGGGEPDVSQSIPGGVDGHMAMGEEERWELSCIAFRYIDIHNFWT